MIVLSPARHGRITASRMADVMRCSSAYIAQLIAERQGSRPPARGEAVSPATAWGHRHERAGSAAWELRHDCDLRRGEFVAHPQLDYIGATPDFYADPDGLVEVKCPFDQSRHLWCLAHGQPWPRDLWQLRAQLWVTGRTWLDYVSFDPRQPPGVDLFTVRVYPNPADAVRMEAACRRLWQFVLAGRVPVTIEDHPEHEQRFF